MTKCKRCGAEIEFREIRTRDGIRIHPFNAGTNTSHFKTCPYAKEFLPGAAATVKQREKQGLDKFLSGADIT